MAPRVRASVNPYFFVADVADFAGNLAVSGRNYNTIAFLIMRFALQVSSFGRLRLMRKTIQFLLIQSAADFRNIYPAFSTSRMEFVMNLNLKTDCGCPIIQNFTGFQRHGFRVTRKRL